MNIESEIVKMLISYDKPLQDTKEAIGILLDIKLNPDEFIKNLKEEIIDKAMRYGVNIYELEEYKTSLLIK